MWCFASQRKISKSKNNEAEANTEFHNALQI